MSTDINNPSGSTATGTAYSGLTSANYNLTSPYAASTLAKGAAASSTPYQAFKIPGGEAAASSARVAGMNPMETKAYEGISGLSAINPMQQGMDLTQQAMGQFGLPAAQQYMSPYMQQVTEQNKQNAIQDWQRQQPQQQAAGFQAGAGRGSRSALLQAESQRNLQNQLGDIQAKGQQQAYEQAQNQFNTEQARKLQGAAQLFGQGTDIYGRQVSGGEAQRQQKQKVLDTMYEDFLKEQGYPKEQVSYMMQLLGQTPQYQDYSTKAYQTAAPVDPNAAAAASAGLGLDSLQKAGGVQGIIDQFKKMFNIGG